MASVAVVWKVLTGPNAREIVVAVQGVTTRYEDKVVHDGIDLTAYRGEVLAIMGGSGCGKSTLLREMVMLQRPSSGSIRVLGEDVLAISNAEAARLQCRFGVLFQSGALFTALTVLENVGAPLREHTRLSQRLIDEIAAMKLSLIGLGAETYDLFPDQLSGGMRKRVALARAIALDPELLFLDEPTSGLDPVTAAALDELVLRLKATLNLSVVMVTHDLDSVWRLADQVVLIGNARVLGTGTTETLARSQQPAVRKFFQGPRGWASHVAI